MTLDQTLAFAVLAGMMALFIWGRLRYDLVAILALLAAVFVGIVPYNKAFSGFSDDIVIIVASALIASAAVARSGLMGAMLQRVSPYVVSVQAQVVVLVTAVTILSAFVKNIGALAMMIPIAFQMARRSNASPSCFLMPMAFGSLLGGLITLVGTSPNIIVSRLRAEMTGQPFGMFDFTPVGLGLAGAGVMFLAFGYRLLPGGRRAAATMDQALDVQDYMTEARVTPGSAMVGKTVRDLAKVLEDEVTITGVVRNKTQRQAPLPDTVLREGDIVLLEGEPQALERAVARSHLELEGEDRPTEPHAPSDEIGAIEAVIGPTSVLIDQSAGRMTLHGRYNVNLLAVSRKGQRFTERLRDIRLQPGDLLVLKGNLAQLPERLKDLGCLPLTEREIRLGNVRRGMIPLAVLGGAMGLTAFGVLPVAIAFFAAATLMIVLGALSLREAYNAVQWPILVMLGALIPVSETIQTSGGADLIAGALSRFAQSLPSYGAVALIMIGAMAVTPFLNNAATVLVMAPIAASFAGQLGYQPDAFLMAVAVGAGCDFLTPIGHQCNTLVMGPGGYRFGDYWRLGAPLSLLVVVLGVPLIVFVWPLVR
jgi:di/tricarboxylate transporter